jgi:hypothetical protein
MRRALVLVFAVLLVACTREAPDSEVVLDDQSGTVRFALSAHTADGSSYWLRDSTIEISGSALLTLSPRDEKGEALTTPLPYGSYTVYLRPGYRVVKVAADGSEQPVDARLSSENPLRFTLGPLEESIVKLKFAVGDEQLVFGSTQPLRVTSVLAPNHAR